MRKMLVKAMSNGPYAIAELDGYKIFIENACPGDEIEAEVYDRRKDFAFAEIKSIISPSSLRDSNPPCKIHKICGSCQWQHIDYREQLKFKKQNLIDLLRKNDLDLDIPDLIGMSAPWNYRNKVIYPASVVPSTGRVVAGYYKRNSHELINVKHCPIQYSIFDEIMETIKELSTTNQLPKAVLRHILVRSNSDNTEVLVSLIIRRKQSSEGIRNQIVKIFQGLREKFPAIKATTINYNDDSTNVILGKSTEAIDSQEAITESFGEIQLGISTTSFFQVNISQFLRIIDLIKKEIPDCTNILDAYSGIGTITLSLAKAFPHIAFTGVELVESAIKDAENNAELNQITNTSFHLAKVEDFVNDTNQKHEYGAVILNPPRKGASNKVLDAVGEMQSPKIIYVSCNPSTLIRDIKSLEAYGYKLKSIQGVDMFPHTYHFETLAVLEKQ